MTTIVHLPYPVPLSACFVNKGRSRTKSDRYRQWCELVSMELLAQRPKPITGPVIVGVEVVPPSRRAVDGDNLLKSIFDSLTQNGLIEDDNNSIIRRFSLEWKSDGQPCTVTITPIEEQS